MALMPIKQAFSLAADHYRSQRFTEAEQLCRLVIAQAPKHADAVHMLGLIHCRSGRIPDGVLLLRRAIALNPDRAELYSNLGFALRLNGQLDESIAACRKAILLSSDNAPAHFNLANALREKGELTEAIAGYRKALSLSPDYADAFINLGDALKASGQSAQAIGVYRDVISLRPDYTAAYINLGNILVEEGQFDEAIAEYRHAISLRPDYAEAFSNLGNAMMSKGQIEEALAASARGVALNPNLPSAHSLLGIILLLKGEFSAGWPEYEFRLDASGFYSLLPHVSKPRWDGTELPGGTILLHAEQGFGDTFQFIRYVPRVAERCGKVIILCQSELRPVLQSMGSIAQWITPSDPLPLFDVHCPLLSLPLAFGTTLQTIPNSVPYLQADPEKIERWRKGLANYRGGIKVGIVWSGRPTYPRNRSRSMLLSMFAALTQVQGVTFFSLQKGEASKQAKNPPDGMTLIDWTEDLTDFSETAALIANLDLVISADTGVVHLAGAMGKPVWTLLSFVPDWRWMLGREDSPWYPAMRLFRQRRIGDWEEVMRRVGEALESETVDPRL